MIKVPSEAVQLNRVFLRKLQERQREYERGIPKRSLNGQSERMLAEKLFVRVSKTTGRLRCGKRRRKLPEKGTSTEGQADDNMWMIS